MERAYKGPPTRVSDALGVVVPSTLGWAMVEGATLGAAKWLRAGRVGIKATEAGVVRTFGEGTVSSVWNKPPVVRGEVIEQALGQNLPKSFPTIDKFVDGVATSIKSIDLRGKTYQNTSKLKSVLEGYVDKVSGFRGADFAKREVLGSAIKGRTLEIAVPNLGTKAQQVVLDGIKEYAASKGVTINLVFV